MRRNSGTSSRVGPVYDELIGGVLKSAHVRMVKVARDLLFELEYPDLVPSRRSLLSAIKELSYVHDEFYPIRRKRQ